jgi:hypothetical protein
MFNFKILENEKNSVYPDRCDFLKRCIAGSNSKIHGTSAGCKSKNPYGMDDKHFKT